VKKGDSFGEGDIDISKEFKPLDNEEDAI